jgi:hypothetical protein
LGTFCCVHFVTKPARWLLDGGDDYDDDDVEAQIGQKVHKILLLKRTVFCSKTKDKIWFNGRQMCYWAKFHPLL